MRITSGFRKKFRRLAKTVGIEFRGFGFHTLRRTYASWRGELGLTSRPDESLVRDMGHSNQETRTGVVETSNLIYFSGESRATTSVS